MEQSVLEKNKRKNPYEIGLKNGKKATIDLFAEKFIQLESVHGIGTKTIDKLKHHFGNDFFKRQLQNMERGKKKRKQAGDRYKELVTVHKTKKGVPTVIQVDGIRYIMDSESARKILNKKGD